MRRRILWTVIGVPLTLIVIGGGAALSIPAVRHLVLGLWNLPDRLPALAGNSQVHFEPGAEDYARDVAALLSDAITRVEVVHGRPFVRPATVGVYATMEAYAIANGRGSTVPVGITTFGRVNLSPKLFSTQHQRLRAILTHELSHAHVVGWIGGVTYIHLPNWFKEGLAVLVSDGGGAELVSEDRVQLYGLRQPVADVHLGRRRHHGVQHRPDRASRAVRPQLSLRRQPGWSVALS